MTCQRYLFFVEFVSQCTMRIIIHRIFTHHMETVLDIQSGCVIRGSLPARQLKLLLAWNELHTDELMQNWELAKNSKPLLIIDPLK